MYSKELTDFLAVHAGSGVGNIAATLKALATSDDLDIPPSIAESLLISANYLGIVSRNAHEIIREDAGARRSALGAVLRQWSAEIAAPRQT